MPRAMPFLHRCLGNPFLSFLARIWFSAPIKDVYCGLRGFSRSFYESLQMQCTGMEFAVEMIIKASLMKAKVAEVPITLFPDGRIQQRSHLRTFRDGWRTLRFFLLYSPRWLFLVPGGFMLAVGLLAFVILLPGTFFVGRVGLDIHTLLFASFAVIVGYDAIGLAWLTRVFAASQKLLPPKEFVSRLDEKLTLETGLLFAGALLTSGLIIAVYAVCRWGASDFGPLNSQMFVRLVVSSTTLLLLGSHTALGMFLWSILKLPIRA